ncbi:MAG: UvrD-helicase domain-containing protein [Phycisphaerales bacterium]|nr:UvrD-helicase domain-containing protein [Phycisphaerales bacterium]
MHIRAHGILASAGTGKTHALTNELIGLLVRGHAPQSIFAATFTRTAAAEILERILHRVCEAAESPRSLKELANAIQAPELTAQDCTRLAGTLARSLDRLSVVTLDSFMHGIAAAFAVELGLPPGWRIAGEDEDRQVRRAAISRVLREGGRQTILPLLRMLKKSEGVRSVRESIANVVNAVHDVHLSAGEGAWTSVQPAGGVLDEAVIQGIIEQLRTCALPLTKSGTPDKRWQKSHDQSIKLALANNWDEFLKKGLGKAADEGTFSGGEFPAELLQHYAALARHAKSLLVAELSAQNLAASRLVARFDAAYRGLKQERGGLRFDDLPRLLLVDELMHIRDELYYRLDARIEHILLDEFQDTSILQFRVIEPLLAEIVSDETRPRSLFYVGDAKQSLFGWRDAEPRLLGRVSELWPQIDTSQLAASYRSSPEIIETVNTVFTGLEGNPAMSTDAASLAAREWSLLFSRHTCADRAAKLPGKVVLREYPEAPDDADKEMLASWRCEYIAERIAELHRKAPGRTIAVLLRSKKSVPRLLMALADAGITAAEEGGSPLTQSPAVAACMSLLKLAEHPGDTIAAFHVASTALGALTRLGKHITPETCTAVAGSVRDDITRDGLAAVVSAWARWLHPACGSMDQVRLMQMVEAAEDYDARGGVGIGAFLELLETTKRPTGAAASVRVMTIHAAKGLEFDAVVVPELDGKVPAYMPEVVFSRDDLMGPISRISLYGNQTLQASCPMLAELTQERMTREIREALCLLYVAMTRAKRYLELIVFQPPKGATAFRLSRILRHALAESAAPAPDGTLWSRGVENWDALVEGEEPPTAPATGGTPRTISVGLAPDAARRRSTTPSRLAEMLGREGDGGRGEHGIEGPLDAPALLMARRRTARGLGIGVHACLEEIRWLEEDAPTDVQLQRIIAAAEVPLGVDPGRVIDVFRRMLDLPQITALLSKNRYLHNADPETTIDLYRELAIQGMQSGRIQRGRIDRLVLIRSGVRAIGAEIIDWKTDGLSGIDADDQSTPLSDADLAAKAEAYRPQVDSYRRAVALMFGLDPAVIKASLVMVGSGQIAIISNAADPPA